MIAQRFALDYPEMTEALVLISAFPYLPEASPESIVESLAPGPVRVESTLQSFLSKVLPRKAAVGTDEDAEGREWLTNHGTAMSRTTLAARTAIAAKFNSSEWLERIEAPTLVMVGGRDRAPFLAGAQLLYEGIPDAELEVIEEGDHFCFYSRHDLVNRAIDDFLREHLTRL
jgi:pimeloyl-ACP methyl ester carboxylesterase